jgi:adenylosuccinate synthase
LEQCKPVYIEMPGWPEDITNIRKFDDLPANAQEYARVIERLVGKRIGFISVGPEREQIICM